MVPRTCTRSQAFDDIGFILKSHLGPTLQWLPPAAGSPSFRQQLLQPGQAPRLPPPAVFNVKRDLGVYVTAIKLANRAACQLERWPTLTDQRPQQHGAAGHEPLQLGGPTAPDRARTSNSNFLLAPLATLDAAARTLIGLERMLLSPVLLAPSFGRWPDPGMEALRPFGEALAAAAGTGFAASGRLVRVLLRACGSAPELMLKGGSKAGLEAGMALDAARRVLHGAAQNAGLLVGAAAGPGDMFRGRTAAEDPPVPTPRTVTGSKARVMELQWAALDEARLMETVSLLLPFLQALQPLEGGAEACAPNNTPALPEVAAQVAVELAMLLPLLSQSQPPCSGPLYDWMGAWGARYSHGGLAAGAAVIHSDGSSSSSRAELVGPDPNELHSQLHRWREGPDSASDSGSDSEDGTGPDIPDRKPSKLLLPEAALAAAAGGQPLSPLLVWGLQQAAQPQYSVATAVWACLPDGVDSVDAVDGIDFASSTDGSTVDAAPVPAALKAFGRHMCWYPECPTFSGASEADVPMERCSACKEARYCGRPCQVAHWRAGHKQGCTKGSGSKGSAAGRG